MKRVQIYVIEDRSTETFEEHINVRRAEEAIVKFKKADEGELPRPPKPWKCRSCEFNAECEIHPM